MNSIIILIKALLINDTLTIYYQSDGYSGKFIITAFGPDQFTFNHETDLSGDMPGRIDYTLDGILGTLEEYLGTCPVTQIILQPFQPVKLRQSVVKQRDSPSLGQ